MKTLVAIVLILVLATPAWAWRGGGCRPYYRPYGCGGRGIGPGAAAGLVVGGALLVGIVALAVAGSSGSGNQAMLDAAANANMYGNYLIAIDAYNRSARNQVRPMPEGQWETLRRALGREVVK